MEKQELTKEAIADLKEKLPRGAINDIAEETGYSRVTVGEILSGYRELNAENIKVIDAACKIIENQTKKVNQSISKLNKLLSDSKA